jgi:DNA-binding transcriptional regulator YiaG
MTWSDPSRAPTSAFSIGQRVRELRGDASQANFAERLGVDRKTVGRWEAGTS